MVGWTYDVFDAEVGTLSQEESHDLNIVLRDRVH
jgi:hypothetical protein